MLQKLMGFPRMHDRKSSRRYSLWFNRSNGRMIWTSDIEIVCGQAVQRHPVPNDWTAFAGMEVEVVKLRFAGKSGGRLVHELRRGADETGTPKRGTRFGAQVEKQIILEGKLHGAVPVVEDARNLTGRILGVEETENNVIAKVEAR